MSLCATCVPSKDKRHLDILIVGPGNPWEITGGGPYQAHCWAEYLSQRGHSVYAVYPSYLQTPAPTNMNYSVSLVRGGAYFVGAVNVVAVVRKILQTTKVDIIHVIGHNSIFVKYFVPETTTLCASSWLPQLRDVRWQDICTRKLLRWRSHLFYLLADKSICRSAARVIVNSEYSAKQAVDNYHIRAHKVRWMYNGVHRYEIVDARNFQMNYFRHPVRLLFVGALISQKGIITLLEMAEILGHRDIPFTLDVVGPGKDKSYVIGKLKAIKTKDKVIFHGVVGHDKVIEYYRNSDIFCFPSEEESFGLVLVEAMAAGLPVISSNSGAIPEVVEEGKTGILVQPGKADKFADAVEFLLNHPDKMRQMGLQGIQRVRENFTWDKAARRLEQIYFECLKQ